MDSEIFFNGSLPDFYEHKRNECFVQVFSLVTDIVGTFMGAFNAYEIQRLKSKFQEMLQGHSMMEGVTQQNNVGIPQMKEILKFMVDTLI
jgi:hypothetical protein